MSIDATIFSNWIAVLQDRAGRRLESPTVRALYAILDASLSTDEFVHACQAWLARSAFLPTPAELVELAPSVQGRDEADAEREFKLALKYVNSLIPQDYDRRSVREGAVQRDLSPAGLVAYGRIGGFEVLRGLQSAEDELGIRAKSYPFVRKEWIAAYREARAAERAAVALQHPAMRALRTGASGTPQLGAGDRPALPAAVEAE